MNFLAIVDAGQLSEVIERYLRDCRVRGLAPSALALHRNNLERYFLPWAHEAGMCTVEDLTQDNLDRFTEFLLTRPSARGGTLSRHTVVSYLSSLRNLIRWARSRGYGIDGTPQKPILERPSKQILTRQDLTLMEDAARTERDKLIVRLLGDRGLRLGELVLLNTSDLVELERGKWFLRVQGKGLGGHGAHRFVPVPYLWRRLQRLGVGSKAADDAMFVSLRRDSGGLHRRMTGGGINQVIHWTAKAAGIERRVHPHLLRHSAITHYAGKGMNRFQLEAIFGNHTTLAVYMHLTPLDAYDWLARLDG